MGQPVPQGVVVTSEALDDFVASHRLQSVLESICAGLDVANPAEVHRIANQIASLFTSRGLSESLIGELTSAIVALGDEVIVRSSAIGEDSQAASFAGQLDSIPDVRGEAAVARAIVRVWASRWSARALTYQAARGIGLEGVAVIVQRQVRSTISGVVFTVAPDNPARMVIEYCHGSGEALVSGRVNPDRIVIDRARLVPVERVAGDPDAPPLLEDPQIRLLVEHARDIERAFGCPQDIEWTIDESGRLWIVQARPITVTAAATGRNTRARVAWSNANVNENFPQPISPFLYSFARRGYYHYFRNLGLAAGVSRRRIAAMEEPLRHIIGVQGARMYYNLSSIHGVLRSAPFGDLLAGWFNRFVGADDTATPAFIAAAAGRGSRFTQLFELASIALHTTWQYLFVTRRIARFERTVDEFAARTRPEALRDRPRRALLDDLRAFLEIRYHRWTDASLADAAAMVCYGALERTLRRACPDDDQAGLHNSLLKALPGLPSGRPAVELWKLSRLVREDEQLLELFASKTAAEVLRIIRQDKAFATFATALDAFLDDWGFRCSGELMLTVPSFQEDPAPLLEIVKAYVAQEGPSPIDHLRAQRTERERDTARLAGALGRRRVHRFVPFVSQWQVIGTLLRWTQRAVILRERARLKQALLYSRLRRVALALGTRLTEEHRLNRAEDIFLLTVDEIDDFVSGAAMFPQHLETLADARRQWHREVSAAMPPDSLTLLDGEYFDASLRFVPAEGTGQPSFAAAGGTEAELAGLGVCGGRTTSRAAVLEDVTETHRLKPGDVLVTRQTDPGWGAVFPLISGLVMERGGMLSHGAIIAREFGIPSVVGVPHATSRIAHGSTIRVDGDLGRVYLESPHADGGNQ